MNSSHTVDLSATPEVQRLFDLVSQRRALPIEEAMRTQPEFERALREVVLAVERRVHVDDFERMDVDVHGIVVDEIRYRRRGEKTVGHYMTLAGMIDVQRTTYRERGGHGGETLVPLELRLGMVDGHWTPAAAEAACAFMAAVPSKEAADLLRAAGTMTPSSSHLDRLPKRVSEVWEQDRARFESEVRDAARLDLPDPEKVVLITLSMDGIMLPMKDAPRSDGSEGAGQGPRGHKEVGCATVSLYDADGERLHTTRFGRMPESYKRSLHEQLLAETAAMVDRYPTARVQALADGARENWRIFGEIAQEVGREFIEALDYFHAAEHLGDGLRAAGASAEEVASWCLRLRDTPDSIVAVIEELGYRAAETGLKAVEQEFNYFLNNAGRIDYANATKDGLPIGSGVQEATCKTLVSNRMKRSGMSWRPEGGQAILTLRGLAQSDRLGHAWEALRPALKRRVDVDPDAKRKLPERLAA